MTTIFAAMLIAANTGCTLLEKCGCLHSSEPVPLGHVDMFFHQEIHLAEITDEPGKQVPGLVGRIWVYSEGATHPEALPGTIKAAVYDTTAVAKGGEAKLLHPYQFAPKAVRSLKREDKIGWGYSLFLPMESYHPGVKQVQVRLWFEAEKDQIVSAVPQVLNLRAESEQPQVHVRTGHVVPGLQNK